MKKFKSQLFNEMTSDGVVSMSTSQLAALYREMTGKPVKKFATRADGLRRLLVAFSNLPDTPESKPTPANGAPKKRKRFDKPSMGFLRRHRADTKRGKTIDMILKGATLEQVMEATGCGRKHAYENVFMANAYHGYGLTEDDAGVIRAYEGGTSGS